MLLAQALMRWPQKTADNPYYTIKTTRYLWSFCRGLNPLAADIAATKHLSRISKMVLNCHPFYDKLEDYSNHSDNTTLVIH
jgi:hypothetical protein